MQSGGPTTTAAAQAVSQPQANAAASQPEAHGFQPWQSCLQTPVTASAMPGTTDHQHQTAQRASGRPPSRISPKPGPIELRPWDPGQAQHLLARRQGFPAGPAVQGLEVDGATDRAHELSQPRSSGNDDDDDDDLELRKVSRLICAACLSIKLRPHLWHNSPVPTLALLLKCGRTGNAQAMLYAGRSAGKVVSHSACVF